MDLYVRASMASVQAFIPLYETEAHCEDGCKDFPTWLEVRYHLTRTEAQTLTKRVEYLIEARNQGIDLTSHVGAQALVGLGDLDVAAQHGHAAQALLDDAGGCTTPRHLRRRAAHQRELAARAAAAETGDDVEAAILEAERAAAWKKRRVTPGYEPLPKETSLQP